MEISLKDFNRPLLAIVLVAHIVAYYLLLSALSLHEAIENAKNYEEYSASVFVAVVLGVLNSLLSSNAKARLVFWRWSDPLPGSRAFTTVMNSDPRISVAALQTMSPDPLPSNPIDQNRLWYKWYLQFSDHASVKQVHREYLLSRDWTALTVLLALGLIPLAFFQMENQSALVLLLAFVCEYLLVRRSASVHGNRFVATVLAIKSNEVK